MRPDEIVDYLRQLSDATSNVAMRDDTDKRSRARLTLQAVVLLDAADLILQLQQRLVRQASYFEVIEAVNEPRWPLLEDNDNDPGAAL